MPQPGIQEPPVKAKPEVDMEVLATLHPELLEDGHIYVHCHFKAMDDDTLIRIWKSTFLIDCHSPSRASLVHAENITYAPLWTQVPGRSDFSFLLIFTMLPSSCKIFDLVEEIPQPGGFVIKGIARNEKDVYHVNI